MVKGRIGLALALPALGPALGLASPTPAVLIPTWASIKTIPNANSNDLHDLATNANPTLNTSLPCTHTRATPYISRVQAMLTCGLPNLNQSVKFSPTPETHPAPDDPPKTFLFIYLILLDFRLFLNRCQRICVSIWGSLFNKT